MRNPLSSLYYRCGLDELLDRFSGVAIRPSISSDLVLSGNLEFSAVAGGIGRTVHSYHVEIHVPKNFPSGMPLVRELANRIPSSYHTMQDGSLCLGSPFQIRKTI